MLLRKFFGGTAVALCALLLLLKKDECVGGVTQALTLCGEVLIPSLFPFAVLSHIASNSRLFMTESKAVKIVFEKLSGLPVCCLPAVLFGFVGGYPVGLSIASDLFESGKIGIGTAKRLCTFCVNAGPSFVVTAVGGMVFGSIGAGWILFSAVSLSSVLTMLISRFVFRDDRSEIPKNNIKKGDLLTSAVSSACGKTIIMCGWVILFSALNAVIFSFAENEKLTLLLRAFSEVTGGVGGAAKLGGLPFAAFCISFGGLCVMCQLLPQIKKCGCKVIFYLAFRIVNGLLSYFLTEIILLFADTAVNTVAVEDFKMFSSSAPASAALIVMCAVFVFDMAAQKPQRLTFGELTGA